MDLSTIVGPALATVGPWGLLILVVAIVLTSLVTGRLVSTNAVNELKGIWEARLNESRHREQDWRSAFERSEERADKLADQVDKLMAYAQTADAILRAIPRTEGRAG